MTPSRDDFPEPIFIGGFGRSGTHAIGPLVGAHPRYHLVETEARFHAVKGGLPDLLAGRARLEDFLEGCRTTWWKRGFMRPQGLHRLVERDELEAALGQFAASYDDDPWEAARRLVRRLIDPSAERAGKPSWVELTGRSVIYAPTLLRLFPRAKFINIVRDGRAVAGGHLKKVDMTDDPLEALATWERMIRASDAGMRGVPREAVLVINRDQLVTRDREGTFSRVVEFLEVEDDAPMRSLFDRKIPPERAHCERWR